MMAEDPADDQNAPFMFSNWELFEPLRKHKSFIFVFTLSAALAALAITYVYSEKYQAETTIFFKPTEVTRLREHDTQAFGAPVPQAAYKVVRQTLEDLANSEPLIRQVVQKLNLSVPEPRVYSGPFYYRWYKETKDFILDYGGDAWSIMKYGRVINGNPTSAAIVQLRKDIKVLSEDSYVFILRARDKYPARVAAIANELARQLVAVLKNNEHQLAETRSDQLRKRLIDKHHEIEDYEQKVQDLLESNQMVSIAQEIDKDMYRFSELELARLNLEAEIRQAKATIGSYAEKLTSKSSATSLPRGEEKIQAEDFRKMTSDKLTSEIHLDGLVAKRASLEDSIGKLKARLGPLPALQVAYELLSNQVQRAERDYSLLNDALQEAIVQEQNNITNLIIENEASEPESPETPVKIYHVGLAAGLAIVLAVGTAFVLGYFNIRFFIPSQGVKGRGSGAQQMPPPRHGRSDVIASAGAE